MCWVQQKLYDKTEVFLIMASFRGIALKVGGFWGGKKKNRQEKMYLRSEPLIRYVGEEVEYQFKL